MVKYLISKSATGKIRVVYLTASDNWNDEQLPSCLFRNNRFFFYILS